jgi:hypothetical protein
VADAVKRSPHALIILQARAEARARMYSDLDMTLDEAVQPLLDYAHRSGVIASIGFAGALAIVEQAFRAHGIDLTAALQEAPQS